MRKNILIFGLLFLITLFFSCDEKPDLKNRIYYHEAGHALMAVLETTYCSFSRATVFPEQNIGYTSMSFKPTKISYKSRIRVYLAGFLAEEIILGSADKNFSSNDFDYIKLYAMAILNKNTGPIISAEDLAKISTDQETNDLIESLKVETRKILKDHENQLKAAARLLMEKKELTKEDLEKIVKIENIRNEK